MFDIQDKSLSLNEKRKIDRVIKKHRGKGIGDKENEVMNALLSYSDIINRKRVILKEAMKAWEVAEGNSGGIITVWDKSKFEVKSDFCLKYYVVIERKWVEEDMASTLINIYARNGYSYQKMIWEEICGLKESERSNYVGLLISSKAFNSFIDESKVVDLPLTGKRFTWFCSNNKMSRLDRFLVDDYWLVCFNDLIQYGYDRSVSNHIPILLYNSSVDWGLRPFKLFNGWLDQKDCKKVIEYVWDGMRGENTKMASKLRRLKTALKNWNGETGGKIAEWDDTRSSRNLNEVEFEEDPKDLKKKVFEYFSNHFSCSRRYWGMILNLDFRRISEKERLWLEQLFTIEEIRDAVWSCNDVKVPGPDSFSMEDLVGMMSNFFLSGKLEKIINSSSITFIPKTESSIEIFNF
ncbi:hypothetical protein V6Z12_A02G119900 [Gossypium hirsutum]